MTIYRLTVDEAAASVHFDDPRWLADYLVNGVLTQTGEDGEAVQVTIVRREMSQQEFHALPAWNGLSWNGLKRQ